MQTAARSSGERRNSASRLPPQVPPPRDAAAGEDRQHATISLGGRDYATQDGLAKMLGVTTRTLGRWDERRIGPPRTKIGRLVLYDLAKLPGWLDRHETLPLPASNARGLRR